MGKFFAGAGSALIGGALSGISNLFGAHSQNQSVDKQLAAAREEAEKTRKWQTSEREAQNDWNYRLWQANNEYNTPAAVQARLEAAGINPDLYVTNGALQGASVQAQGGHTPSGPVADTSAWNRYKPIGNEQIDFGIYLLDRCINLFNHTTGFRGLCIVKLNLTAIDKNNTVNRIQLSLIKSITKRSIRGKNIIRMLLTFSFGICLRHLSG